MKKLDYFLVGLNIGACICAMTIMIIGGKMHWPLFAAAVLNFIMFLIWFDIVEGEVK